MLKKIFSVRLFLTVGLLVSVLFASYSIYYKITYWGFDVFPTTATSVWTIESQLTFTPTQDNITVKFARPSSAGEFKILDESVIAKGYDIQKSKDYFTLTAPAQTSQQDIYYRILIYDMTGGNGETKADKPKIPPLPVLSDHAMDVAGQILALAEQGQGDDVQKIIRLLNQNPPNETVAAFMPERKSAKDTAQMAVDLLAIRHIPARIVRGIRLSEGKKTFTPDVMLEAYTDNYWRVYDIETGQTGLPDNFVIFQHGDSSLADVTGGMDSTIKYAVLKSITSSFKMAKHRAKNTANELSFDYSIYNLPISQQNAVKWLTIFPLAILIIVLLRNVIGIKTMGTFTPMLIALSLVSTGFYAGFISFCLIVGLGMAVRALLSRFNLLLVPRISSVVIFVILIMQSFAVIGYQWDLKIASSALFFPIIIMAWIIERASIIWEEEGFKNAAKEIFFSLLAAVITYFVIVNATIRHIMFAFDELNLVILFTVMLLGTYTGYRLTELKRFAPLVKKKSKR
ncbi:MAG: UUP1 family membrane protein [Alphaproteobacteria bacterium]